MYQCPHCAFAFAYPPPSFSETAEVYEDAYTADPSAELKTKRLAQDYLCKIRPFVPDRCAFLEVGGSHGWLSEAVQKTTHADVTMVEPGRTAVQAAMSRGLNAVCAFLHQFKPKRRYDILFSAHVVEHVTDIDAFLCQCYALLEKEGKLILLTPNARAWKFRWLKSHWAWAAPGSHLNFLSKESAQILLERNGFVVNAIKGMRPGRAHYPVVLARLLSERYTRLFSRAEASVPAALPTMENAAATTQSKRSGLKSALVACGRKAGRPILWAEFAFLNLLDVLAGEDKADELLIVASIKQ